MKNLSPADRSTTTVFRALEPAGAAPAPDGPIGEIGPHVGIYACGSWLVIQKITGSRTVLVKDEQKREFLDRIIRSGK